MCSCTLLRKLVAKERPVGRIRLEHWFSISNYYPIIHSYYYYEVTFIIKLKVQLICPTIILIQNSDSE